MTELLAELEVAEFAALFEARAAAAVVSSGLPALVARAWDLSGLVDRYEAFAAEFSPFLRASARARLLDSEAFLVRTRLVHLFRGFPFLDPELPEELAPLGGSLGGARSRAVSTFHELYEGLAEPSQRHFEAVSGAYAGVS